MEKDRDLALQTIHDGKLEHPDLAIVESFLLHAKDGEHAAKYLLQVCKDDTTGVKFYQFVKDWKALVKLCESKHKKDTSNLLIAKSLC